MVGWESEYSYSNLVPKGVIAVTCNVNGQEYSNVCFDDYQIISYDNGANYHSTTLSISGRDNSGNGILYTFSSEEPMIYFKDVGFPSCALRKRNSSFENEISIFPNPFTDKLMISSGKNGEKIYFTLKDIFGNSLINISGSEATINTQLNNIISKLPRGTYIVQMRSEDSEIGNKKIVKM